VLNTDIVGAGGGSNLMVWFISSPMKADHVGSRSGTY